MPDSTPRSVSPDATADQFRDLLRGLSGGADTLEMESLVRHATMSIRGAEHAAVSLASTGREPTTVFSTDELPMRVDALQYETGEGPCVAALSESDLVLVNDLAEDEQFPRFAPGAVALDVRSMLSTRLFLSRDHRAALNLYSARAHAFTLDQLPLAAIFGAFASVVLVKQLHQESSAGLERALESNREIGVAIGILMAQQRYTRDQAFEELRIASQRLNRRLRDIAEVVTETGKLPAVPEQRRRNIAGARHGQAPSLNGSPNTARGGQE